MRMLVALLAGLALSLSASGDGIEHTTSFAVEGAYWDLYRIAFSYSLRL